MEDGAMVRANRLRKLYRGGAEAEGGVLTPPALNEGPASVIRAVCVKTERRISHV